MSLLLPDHDTKRDCVFKIGGRDPNASGARAPRHSDPLHPVPGDGGWFRRGPSGSFRLDEPRPSLHSHWVGTATLRWLADAHLEVRRRLVNSLLERLRRRLRELGRPLREGPSLDGRRHSSCAAADDAPSRRTEIELSHPSRSADRTGSGERASLPAQQPPPPRSTRLKAAVFSKKRHPGPHRHTGPVWGPTSFLDIGMTAAAADRGGRTPLTLFDTEAVATGAGPRSDRMQGPLGQPPATASTFEACAEVTTRPWWSSEPPLTQDNAADLPAPRLVGATPLECAPALAIDPETSRQVPETLPLDADFANAPSVSSPWRRD